jgi:transposase
MSVAPPAGGRFWRSGWISRYNACVLPTKIPHAATHTIATSNFSERVVQLSAFAHRTMKSLCTSVIPDTSSWLGMGVSSAPCKRPRVDMPALPTASEHDADDVNRKRKGGNIDSTIRAYKLRIYPGSEQQSALFSWMDATNVSYNLAIDMIHDTTQQHLWTKIRNEITLKSKTLPGNEWTLKTPKSVREQGVKEAVVSFNTSLKVSREKRRGRAFNMTHRSRKNDDITTINLSCAQVGDRGPLPYILPREGDTHSKQKKLATIRFSSTFSKCLGGTVDKDMEIRDRAWLIDRLVSDGKLIRDGKILYNRKLGYWYLIIALDVKKKPVIDGLHPKVVSLDPGARSFNVFYEPNGTHGDLLANVLPVLQKLNMRTDILVSKMQKELVRRKQDVGCGRRPVRNHAQQYKRTKALKRKIAKLRHKKDCYRTNAHYDATNFLLKEYDHVVIPKFPIQRMVKKEGGRRKIGRKTVRDLYSWSHFQFRMRLVSKAELDDNKVVRSVGEPGTSGTCGNCGRWNDKLGGGKIYSCTGCGVVIDRDVNGARNNMLAAFVD